LVRSVHRQLDISCLRFHARKTDHTQYALKHHRSSGFIVS